MTGGAPEGVDTVAVTPGPGVVDAGYQGARVAVLGAGGFIGRWVARGLAAAGARVCAVVRPGAAATDVLAAGGARPEVVELDLRQTEALRALLRRLRPAIVFNLAGYGVDPSEVEEQAAYALNAGLAGILCETLAEARDPNWSGQHLLQAGSGLECGAIGGDMSEDAVPVPTTLYGRTKLAGTRLLAEGVKMRGIRGATARLFTVYGPGEHPGRLLPSLIETARAGGVLRLTPGDQQRDFTYVADVAEGFLRLARSATPPGQVVNLATGRTATVRTFVETAARILRIPQERLQFGSLTPRWEGMSHGEVTVARLRALTGWVPATTMEEGIGQTVAWTAAAGGTGAPAAASLPGGSRAAERSHGSG